MASTQKMIFLSTVFLLLGAFVVSLPEKNIGAKKFANKGNTHLWSRLSKAPIRQRQKRQLVDELNITRQSRSLLSVQSEPINPPIFKQVCLTLIFFNINTRINFFHDTEL